MPTRIGLWGGTGSGKTTYLAVLSTAALLMGSGEWIVHGDDDTAPGSTDFLTTIEDRLRKGLFPDQTTGTSTYAFTVNGTVRASNSLSRLLNSSLDFWRGRDVEFKILVRDEPGGDFMILDLADPLWQYLASCDGLIYLHNPVPDTSRANTTNYIRRPIDMVYQTMSSAQWRQNPKYRQLIGNKMPQFLAICLTQYDHPEVLSVLHKKGLIVQDKKLSGGVPLVKDARSAVAHYMSQLELAAMTRSFVRDRIQYFATTAIGFRKQDDGSVDIENCSKIMEVPGGTMIRGEVDPANVFSPLLWIEDCVSQLMSTPSR